MELVRVIPNAHDFAILSVAYSALHKELFSGSQDCLIKAWDAQTGQLLRKQTGHSGWITDLLFVPELRLLFSCSIDHTIRVWSDKGKQAQVDMAAAARAAVQRRTPSGTEATTLPGGSPIFAAVTDDSNKVLHEAMPPLQGPQHCQSDIIRSVVCTDMGFIVTLSYDRAMFIYGEDHLATPKRVAKASAARFSALAWDKANNWLLTGAADGCVKVWSQEGRILDELMHTSDQAAALCYVPATKNYWVTGQHGNIQAFDPRAPGDVTPFIRATRVFADSNLQGGMHVTQLRQPPDSDVVIACTAKRQLMMWHYSPGAAFRTFTARQTWVEAVLVVQPVQGEPSVIYSACADGHVLRWELDADLNADSYRVGEEMPLHDSNVLAMVYSHDLEALITASQDTTIRVHWHNLRQHKTGMDSMQGVIRSMEETGFRTVRLGATQRFKEAPAAADESVPGGTTRLAMVEADRAAGTDAPSMDVVLSHEGRVTGLALLPDWTLASVSHDRTIRLWDLHTFKLMKTVKDAHETPLQGIDYSSNKEEFITWAMDNFAYVWDAVTLNTKYALVGHTAEVTQARWVEFKECWVTGGDDDTLRTWSTDGTQLHQFAYMGGSVQCLFVDNANSMVLAAMLDKVTRAYDLESKHPAIKYVGHEDMVRGIDYLPEKGLYITGSWDESLRLWYRVGHPNNTPRGSTAFDELTAGIDTQEPGGARRQTQQLPPLEVPKALQDVKTDLVQLFLTNMASDEMGQRQDPPLVDLSGLGSQLGDLDRKLVKDLEAVAPDKSGTVKRGSKQGIPFSTMSRSQRRASRVRHDSNLRQASIRQLSIQSVESTKSAKSQA
ncbi:TPA: hypothetical protein ACH3X1_006940 [Trebouxia sp. C0004]